MERIHLVLMAKVCIKMPFISKATTPLTKITKGKEISFKHIYQKNIDINTFPKKVWSIQNNIVTLKYKAL
jgi:hypothetical protein